MKRNTFLSLQKMAVYSSLLEKSSLFMILGNLYKKIPNWLKFLFKLLLLIIVVIKLLGFSNIFDFLTNMYYLKLYVYIAYVIVNICQILNLYLLHKFINKTIKISDMLPEFIIDWLKDLEVISRNKVHIKHFKNTCYFHIGLYAVIIILFILLV